VQTCALPIWVDVRVPTLLRHSTIAAGRAGVGIEELDGDVDGDVDRAGVRRVARADKPPIIGRDSEDPARCGEGLGLSRFRYRIDAGVIDLYRDRPGSPFVR